MTELQKQSKLKKLSHIFRINMLIGLAVAIVAIYFIVTGTYANIQIRETTESTLNWLGIGGMLYLVGFWYMCVFKHQLFFKNNTKKD